MQPVSTRRLVAFTPDGAEPFEGYDKPPVYKLRVASMLEQTDVQAAAVAAGVRPVSQQQIRATMVAVMRRHLPDADLYVEALDRREAGESDGEDIALLQDAELQISHDPQYARLLAMRMKWEPALQWFSLRFALEAVENASFTVERGPDGLVTEESLGPIPRSHMEALSARAGELTFLGGEEKKDSGSPSQ